MFAGGFIRLGGAKNSQRWEFSDSVLGILAYAPDPQAALEEANARKEAGEEVTAKAARIATGQIMKAANPLWRCSGAAGRAELENFPVPTRRYSANLSWAKVEIFPKVSGRQTLVEAERRADAAEAAAKPDQNRLIRELAVKRKGGGISEAEKHPSLCAPLGGQRSGDALSPA